MTVLTSWLCLLTSDYLIIKENRSVLSYPVRFKRCISALLPFGIVSTL
nr:MAG TPA: hypothetical protein [Caudoviricetes sp.]